MKTVIFLGPTMPHADARAILDAVYLPPAAQADVISAVHIHRPDVIGIVDGVFGRSLSIWHKEILYALERGIRVFGASSMGALRAAETDAFGTVGVGEIYRMYASGELNDDDEVVLLHATEEFGWKNITLPMVNVRATLGRAREDGEIDDETCRRLTDIAKSIYYEERIFSKIADLAVAQGMEPEVLRRMDEYFRRRYVDLKRADAEAMLRAIRDLSPDTPPPEPNFTLQRTYLFNALYNLDRRGSHDGDEVSLETIAKVAALHQPDFSMTNFHAANRKLVSIMAEMLDVTVAPDDVKAEARRLRARLRLEDDEAFHGWLAANDLEERDFVELMREMAACRAMQRWLWVRTFVVRNTRIFLDELRIQGRYPEWALRAAAQERAVREAGPQALRDDSRNLRALLEDHLRNTDWSLDTGVDEWSEEAGFRSKEELRTHLLRSRIERDYVSDLMTMAGD